MLSFVSTTFEVDEQRAQSLPRTSVRPRRDSRTRRLRRFAGHCCCGGHLDAIRGSGSMELVRTVRCVRHRVRARLYPPRRLVLVQPASTHRIGHPIAAGHDRLVVAGMRRCRTLCDLLSVLDKAIRNFVNERQRSFAGVRPFSSSQHARKPIGRRLAHAGRHSDQRLSTISGSKASCLAKMAAISLACSVPQVHRGTIASARLRPSGVSA